MASTLIKILLVEAFSDHIEMIRQILEKDDSNYTLEVTDTEEGLKQAVQEHHPDIILSNTVFPAFEGKSIFNLAKERAPQTPFIFISDSAEVEPVIHFFREGLHDFVLKDNIANLPSSIKLALEKSESENCSPNTEETVNRLNKTLDASMDVICTIDAEGKFVDVNAASLKNWGYTPEELKGTQFLELVYKEDLEKTINEDSSIKDGVETGFFENRYVHKNGTIVSNLWSARWDEALQLVLCVAKDITDKRTLEKTIQQEKKRFHDLYEKAPSGMGILKGPNHIYELANPPYLKIIGKHDENVIGKTVKEILPELEAQGIYALLDHVYQTGETFSASEMLFKFDFNGDGILNDVYLDFIYQAHRDSDGNIDGIYFFLIF